MSTIDIVLRLSKERGISQAFICNKLGLSRNYLSEVKKGKTSLSDDRLIIIADILNTTPEYLKGETDIKEKPTARNGDEHSEIMKKIISGSSKLPEEKQLLVLELIKSIKEDQ